jgi:hypothetical protein
VLEQSKNILTSPALSHCAALFPAISCSSYQSAMNSTGMLEARNVDLGRDLCDIRLEFSFRITGKRTKPITKESISYLKNSSSRVC